MTPLARSIFRFLIALSLLGLVPSAARAVASVEVHILDPGADTGNNPPLAFVDLLLDLEQVGGGADAVPEVTVERQDSETATVTPGDTSDLPPDCTGDCDEVELSAEAALIDDRYTLRLTLFTNFGPSFENTMMGDEIFTVSVDPDFDIRGVCPLSFYFEGGMVTPWTEALDTEPASVESGGESFAEACERFRPDLHTVLVLDKSGSMSGPAARPKIQILREAVEGLATIWEDLRAEELAPPADDRVGMVLFDHDTDWWGELPPCGDPADPTTCLHLFDDVAGDFTPANLGSIPASGATSIGGGVELAFEAHDPASGAGGPRRVILLMSDGLQNTTPCIGATGDQVYTHPCGDASDRTFLGHEDRYQIYAVTLGPEAHVDATVNMNLANATGGFYANTEDDADLLRPFFLEMLQNFLQFNSHQTALFAATRTGLETPIDLPVPSSSTALSVSAMWNPEDGRLVMTLTPPGGSPMTRTGNGAIHWTASLPLQVAGDHIGTWTVRVDTIEGTRSVPVKLHAIVHDLGMRSTFSIAPGDYTPGDALVLRARLEELGEPFTELGSSPGDVARVRIASAEIPLGELLSDSTASSEPPADDDGDSLTPAEAKLVNELAENPGGLQYGVTEVPLFDDGDPAHGDEVAGDGVYSARHPVETVGHYNCLFQLRGQSARVGEFRREQLVSAYVRPEMDGDRSGIESSIQTVEGTQFLNLVVTPRTRFGHRIGPLYQNYVWATTADGRSFRLEDQLDGTYRADVRFTGQPPRITVHWVPPTTVVRGDPTPEELPVPLDDGTAVATAGGGSRLSLSLHAGWAWPSLDGLQDGPAFGLDLEYLLSPRLALEGYLGYAAFDDENVAGVGVDGDLDLTSLSAFLKYYLGPMPTRVFLEVGPGVYRLDFDDGDSDTEIGIGAGLGLQHELQPRLAVELTGRYHLVDSDPSLEYGELLAGLRFRF